MIPGDELAIEIFANLLSASSFVTDSRILPSMNHVPTRLELVVGGALRRPLCAR
jgi:hypothetical protein